MKRVFILLFGIASLLVLGGCVSIEQNIVVQEDGAGTLRFAYGVETSVYPQFELALPQEYQLDSLFSTLVQDENITEVRQLNYEENGITWQVIEIDVLDFPAVFEEERRFGPIIMTVDEQDGIYHFEQIVDLNLVNINIPGMYLLEIADASYRVNLETPQVIDTNGVQRKAGTSMWSISLPDLVSGEESIYIEAEYILEPYEGVFIPWEVYFPFVVIGFLGIGVISIVAVIIANTSKNKEKEPSLKF